MQCVVNKLMKLDSKWQKIKKGKKSNISIIVI